MKRPYEYLYNTAMPFLSGSIQSLKRVGLFRHIYIKVKKLLDLRKILSKYQSCFETNTN